MSRIVQTEIFKYNELNEKAQQKARDWYRTIISEDSFWSESVIEDAKDIGKLLGITIDEIYWSGFWSQGDGACFEGKWAASDVDFKSLNTYIPQDKELQHIGGVLAGIKEDNPNGIASIAHRGFYYHSHSMEIDIDNVDEFVLVERSFIEFADWIYKCLEKEYEYANSDEQVAECILANDYEFTKDGKRFI